MNIKVSVIMPSLNVADYIEESVRSVMNQTLKEIEIICVDAGSSDGTCEIIEKLASEDSRIKYIKSSKKSYGYQVNKGIKAASGEYIAVVETDDYVPVEMYSELYEEAKKKDAEIVKGDYYAYYTLKNGERLFLNRTTSSDKTLYGVPFSGKEKIRLATEDCYLWSGIYKKSFLLENSITFHETAGAAFQDIGFLHKTNTKANRITYIKKPYYYYCIDRETASSNDGKGLLYSCNEFKLLLEEFDNNDPLVLNHFYLRMAQSFYSSLNNLDSIDKMYNQEYLSAYNWLKEEIVNALEMQVINKHQMSNGFQKKTPLFLDSAETIIKYRLNHDKVMMDKIAESSIVIFGCGYLGYKAYRNLSSKNYRIVAFTDNNSQLWGKNIDDISIVDPNECIRYSDAVYLVANEKYYTEITNQLIDYGVPEDKIITYR